MILERSLLKQLHPKEQVVLLIREYSITKFFHLAIIAIVYFGLMFFMYSLLTIGSAGLMVLLVGLISVIVYALRTFIMWYLDVMIVTKERLIDVHQIGLFKKSVQVIEWPAIADVSYAMAGLFATVFRYGTVTIRLADPMAKPIDLHHVYQPQQIRDILATHAKTKNKSKEKS